MMNPMYRLYCRAYQTAFRVALPVLPYREPKLLATMDDVAAVLNERKIPSVLLVVERPM